MTIRDIFRRIFHENEVAILPVSVSGKDREPALVENRNDGNRAALIFVHGFHGDATATWTSFVTHILSDQRLSDWDVYSAGLTFPLETEPLQT